MFRALDFRLWRTTEHNAVALLRCIERHHLDEAAADPAFLDMYDGVMADFDANMSRRESWFTTNYDHGIRGPIAFFSMEFAIHSSLPVYAGGLGVLAGDVCKEASDLGLPLVAVGFMYPQGHFHQHIGPDGWQEEVYLQIDRTRLPVSPVQGARAGEPVVSVKLAGRSVNLAVWQVRVGHVSIYLLDTDTAGNSAQDRQLSARLYVADAEIRIQQEILLGFGGVRVLRRQGISPTVWHANEGHTAFMMMERVRELVQQGMPAEEARRRVRSATVLTTHTPVPAGHHIFSEELVARYLGPYREEMGVSQETLMSLGRHSSSDSAYFNMTALAMRLSDHHNAVSKLHEKVTKRMWSDLWPDVPESQAPVTGVTNGVHLPTWIAPEVGALLGEYLGPDWLARMDDPAMWDGVAEIPPQELWFAHRTLKRQLMSTILERTQRLWAESELTARQIVAAGVLLDPEVLTIGYVRRFTEYKRPALVFHDIQRLKRIVRDPWQPVQIVFAGKSHPADTAGKNLLREVFTLALDRDFEGRIAFVEDYNMHMARVLSRGVDVWLNTPRRLQEACGTSGMKASMNGVLHLSVRDGWWYEAFDGGNGWAIGDGPEGGDKEKEDEQDAGSLYDLLEKQIVPLYYERDRAGIPQGWIRMVKQAMRSVAPAFCARRMMKEYTQRLYVKAGL